MVEGRQSARRLPPAFQKAGLLTITVFMVLCISPVPAGGRLFILFLMTFGWIAAIAQWSIGRFGKVAVLIIMGFGLALGGSAGYAYWQDTPNRRLVTQVEELHAFFVFTTGTFFTGEIDSVMFDSHTSDDDVRQFIQLDGLGGLKSLVFKGTRLTDDTAWKLDRFTQLTRLCLEGTDVSQDTIDYLEARLPLCDIDVR